jgi:hypothetical protein
MFYHVEKHYVLFSDQDIIINNAIRSNICILTLKKEWSMLQGNVIPFAFAWPGSWHRLCNHLHDDFVKQWRN